MPNIVYNCQIKWLLMREKYISFECTFFLVALFSSFACLLAQSSQVAGTCLRFNNSTFDRAKKWRRRRRYWLLLNLCVRITNILNIWRDFNEIHELDKLSMNINSISYASIWWLFFSRHTHGILLSVLDIAYYIHSKWPYEMLISAYIHFVSSKWQSIGTMAVRSNL